MPIVEVNMCHVTRLCLKVIVICVVCSISNHPTRADNDTNLWVDLEAEVRHYAREGAMKAWSYIGNVSKYSDVSDDCKESLYNLLRDAAGLKRWAFQMLDATGKPMGGIINGKLGMFGNFDECLEIVVPPAYDKLTDLPDNPFKFKGQYCLLHVWPPLPKMQRFIWHWRYLKPLRNVSERVKTFNYLITGMGYVYDLPLRMSICVPSTCNRKELTSMINHALSPFHMRSEVYSCVTDSKINLEPRHIVILSVLSLFLLIVVIGTFADYQFTNPRTRDRTLVKRPPPSSVGFRILLAFSLRSNMRKLLETKKPADNTFSAFSGIRFLTMVWVVMGHTSLTFPPFNYRHGKQAKELMSDAVMQFMYNAFLSVDTFFLVSLLPSELLLLAIAEMVPFLNNAPLWNEYFDSQTKTCRKSWWTIMLFIQNLIYPKDTCHLHLWYVAMDMQFLIVTIIYLFILFKYGKAGIVFILTTFVVGIVTTSLVTYSRGFPPSIHMVQTNLREIIEFFQYWYLLPYSHLSVCAIGMFLGTFLVKHSNLQISMKAQAFGWLVALFGFSVPIYVTTFWHSDRDLHPAEVSVYNGLHRPVWAMSLSWLIVMCATGHGGFINELLSWKGFIPLNRSSYMLYLMHITVCQFFFRSLTGPHDTTKTGLFWCFFANVLCSYVISVVLRILFEAPLEELDKIFFSSLITRARDSSPSRNPDRLRSGSGSVPQPVIVSKTDIESQPGPQLHSEDLKND